MVDISSYANESVLRPFNLINFTMPGGTYVTPFIDVSKYNNFTVLASTNTAPLIVSLNHSVDATGLGAQQILEPLTPVAVILTMTNLGIITVKSRFLRIALNVAAGSVINLQLVFHEESLGLSNLSNVGSGTQIFVAPSSMKTLTSNDLSVTITSTATEIDLSAAGLGVSPYQQTADDITPVSTSVNSKTSGNTTGGFGTATNCQLSSSNVCNHSANNFCTIDSSETCSISGAAMLNSSIISSLVCDMFGSGGSGDQNLIAASIDCEMGQPGVTEAGNRNSIISSSNSSIFDTSTANANIIGSDNCNINGGADYSGILACDSCNITGTTTFNDHITSSNLSSITINADYCSMQSCDNCLITGGSTLNSNITASSLCTMDAGCDFSNILSSTSCTLGGGRSLNSSIIASNNCQVISGGADLGDRCVIIASDGCNIQPSGSNMSLISCLNTDLGYVSTGTLSAAIAFSNLPHPGGGGNCVNSLIAGGTNGANPSSFSHSTILGSNWSNGHSGHFMFTDNGGGTTHSTFANNSFAARCAGGARFLSNTANTTGVTLAAGGSAWAAVSDRNKKENIVEIDCDDILERVKKLPIYKYNFKGNAKEIECIGPMAQDWHEIVTPLQKIEGYKGARDAKDKLSIEDMDMIGVCLAAIKALTKEVEELKALIKIPSS